MSAIDKTKQALAIAEKHGFRSIIGIDATRFKDIPASVQLADVTELTGFDCQVVDHEQVREVFTVLDGVRVFAMMQIETCVA